MNTEHQLSEPNAIQTRPVQAIIITSMMKWVGTIVGGLITIVLGGGVMWMANAIDTLQTTTQHLTANVVLLQADIAHLQQRLDSATSDRYRGADALRDRAIQHEIDNRQDSAISALRERIAEVDKQIRLHR